MCPFTNTNLCFTIITFRQITNPYSDRMPERCTGVAVSPAIPNVKYCSLTHLSANAAKSRDNGSYQCRGGGLSKRAVGPTSLTCAHKEGIEVSWLAKKRKAATSRCSAATCPALRLAELVVGSSCVIRITKSYHTIKVSFPLDRQVTFSK